ncbi:uncharacterized protein LOC143462172 isoform X2 [Clavelina lepadiformis]|uniref:uncharacterized protein LOC143462172 isoform X2 n=1 Tax=Clavelina lepadiformis TaxID=159417 RepID=UPI00404106AB
MQVFVSLSLTLYLLLSQGRLGIATTSVDVQILSATEGFVMYTSPTSKRDHKMTYVFNHPENRTDVVLVLNIHYIYSYVNVQDRIITPENVTLSRQKFLAQNEYICRKYVISEAQKKACNVSYVTNYCPKKQISQAKSWPPRLMSIDHKSYNNGENHLLYKFSFYFLPCSTETNQHSNPGSVGATAAAVTGFALLGFCLLSHFYWVRKRSNNKKKDALSSFPNITVNYSVPQTPTREHQTDGDYDKLEHDSIVKSDVKTNISSISPSYRSVNNKQLVDNELYQSMQSANTNASNRYYRVQKRT